MGTRDVADNTGVTVAGRAAKTSNFSEQQIISVLSWSTVALGTISFVLASVAIAHAGTSPAGLASRGNPTIAVVFLVPFVALACFVAISRTRNAANSRIARQATFAVCSAAVLAAIPITAKLLMDSMFSCYVRLPGCPAPSDAVRGLYQTAAYCTGAAGVSLLVALVLLNVIQTRTDAPAAAQGASKAGSPKRHGE